MRLVLTIVAALAGTPFVTGGAAADEISVTCRSNDYRPAACPIDRNAVEVELRRQLSGASCIQNQTWGARYGEIWVNRGCAAEFTVYTRGARRGGGDLVRCESREYRHQSCAISERVREVELARKISNAPCTYGHSWGFERGRIWVDKGCAAEFEISYSDSDRGGARRRHDDRAGGLDALFAERAAIRACRRYGEDNPDRLGANWADANPHESFRASPTGGRNDEWTVSGRFKTLVRGREGSAIGRCVVANDRVTRFIVN